MPQCSVCKKEFGVEDMIWECNRVEVASIDPANETYEINNIDFSELYCDECHDKIYNS